jgi:hypothetical protein
MRLVIAVNYLRQQREISQSAPCHPNPKRTMKDQEGVSQSPLPLTTASARSNGNAAAYNNTMRAVVWEGKVCEISVKDVPRPKIQVATDVIVRSIWAAICSTDLHTYRGILGGSDVPHIMGHEAISVIDEVGDFVTTYETGDTVVIPDALPRLLCVRLWLLERVW